MSRYRTAQEGEGLAKRGNPQSQSLNADGLTLTLKAPAGSGDLEAGSGRRVPALTRATGLRFGAGNIIMQRSSEVLTREAKAQRGDQALASAFASSRTASGVTPSPAKAEAERASFVGAGLTNMRSAAAKRDRTHAKAPFMRMKKRGEGRPLKDRTA